MSGNSRKPTGGKNYGSIPHLPNSRLGPGDYSCDPGMAKIATEKTRDEKDRVVVQEKLDGTNVGVAKVNGEILALQRAGYLATTSPHKMHHYFAEWVERNRSRFDGLLKEGERVCGEWLIQAHGTRYKLNHEPFVAFDLMAGKKRVNWSVFDLRTREYNFVTPYVIGVGGAMSVEEALKALGEFGKHGALDPVEGAMWRVERVKKGADPNAESAWEVDFLVKYVRPNKKDGRYLPEVSGEEPVWNCDAEEFMG